MLVKCKNCGKLVTVPVTEEQVNEWTKSGEYIQNYFPQLSAAEREMFLSGICDECWNKLMPEGE